MANKTLKHLSSECYWDKGRLALWHILRVPELRILPRQVDFPNLGQTILVSATILGTRPQNLTEQRSSHLNRYAFPRSLILESYQGEVNLKFFQGA